MALWRDGEHVALIDITGRVLARVGKGSQPALPVVAGHGAPEATAELLAALELHPDLARRIDEEDLTEVTFVNAMCEPPEVFSYGGLLAHVLTFAAHRRTLVCGALWSAGIADLGAGDPRDWVSRPG